jgi:hypothetical protein
MPTTSPVTTFTWAIANLERETDDGFVFTAHYTVNANDGTYTSGAYGSIGFERPDSLIPYKPAPRGHRDRLGQRSPWR